MEKKAAVFAVLGHPNEGKSSVVATLAEDDSVRISPTPGETRRCREYPVIIDGREIIRFVDTPGFQQPRKSLAWMKNFEGPEEKMLNEFLASHRNDPDFADECELLTPVAGGAGIIFVTDGSRPVRSSDHAEMEILRLTALPRMAVINPKDKKDTAYLEQWKSAARKYFNVIRIFDAQKANYAERIGLLESLKAVDPDWENALSMVIKAFEQDWNRRISETSGIIIELAEACAVHSVSKYCRDSEKIDQTSKELLQNYKSDLQEMERTAHRRIKKRFKHNIFSLKMPEQSILNEDLFSSRTWKILGLERWQLAAAAGAGGGFIGAHIDLALAGLGFGVFTVLGGALGAGSAALSSRRMAKAKIAGLPVGRAKIKAGPAKNDQMLFILIDRALIYFSIIINWAHSRRDAPAEGNAPAKERRPGYTASWDNQVKQNFIRFFQALRKGNTLKSEELKPGLIDALRDQLNRISNY